MSRSKPFNGKDLQDFTEALDQNQRLKFQLGGYGQTLILYVL